MTGQARLAILLAAVAGFADAVGYLTLHHLFTAHMTGNASKLGVAFGHGDLAAAVPLAVAPLLFVGGVAAGTLLLDASAQWAVLALQAALVAVYMGYGSTVIHHGFVAGHSVSGFYVLAVVATLALGLQTAALTELDGQTTRTTYVSGMLTRLAQAAVRRDRNARARGRLVLPAAIWTAYVAGATAGASSLRELAIWCLAFPLAGLVVAAVASYAGTG